MQKNDNLLADKIYSYDLRFEIYYKYRRTKSPDGKHQGFLFYKNIASYQKNNFKDKHFDVFTISKTAKSPTFIKKGEQNYSVFYLVRTFKNIFLSAVYTCVLCNSCQRKVVFKN